MKTETTVIPTFTKWFFLFISFFLLITVQAKAQSEEGPEDLSKKYFTGFDQLGISVGMGASTLKLQDFNSRLNTLELPELNETLFLANFSLSLMNKAKDEIAVDYVPTGTASYNENTHVLLRTSTFGISIYKSLLPRQHKVGIHFLAGLRGTNMKFEYNNSRNAANSFNSLFTNQPQDARQITLRSQDNMGYTFGGRLMLPLTGRESIKPWKFSLALESGYSYYFINEPWKEMGAFRAVADMPDLKPDNFFVHLTFSGRVKI